MKPCFLITLDQNLVLVEWSRLMLPNLCLLVSVLIMLQQSRTAIQTSIPQMLNLLPVALVATLSTMKTVAQQSNR